MNRHQHMSLGAAGAAAVLTVTGACPAQSNLSPVNKYSWSENCGWMDWRDAGSPPAAQGARISATCLSGYIWCENIGYILLGDGAPANGASYANINTADFGVNRAGDGTLSGLAWGENIGWINFGGGAAASPPNPARFDTAASRLRGYAWAENIGWIDLDDPGAFVGVIRCPCDWNNSGAISVQDIFDFLASYFAGNGDFNQSNATTVQDIFDFLACYFAGCP